MSNENIKVYCRIRPIVGKAHLTDYEVVKEAGTLKIFVPESISELRSHNKASSYKFTFNQVFDQDAEQDQVYKVAARPVLENALRGYNGTVFVYGQTATGKTYTIIGEQVVQQQVKRVKRGKKKKKARHKIKRRETTISDQTQAETKAGPHSSLPTPTGVVENSTTDNLATEATQAVFEAISENPLAVDQPPNPSDLAGENPLGISEGAGNAIVENTPLLTQTPPAYDILENDGIVQRILNQIFAHLATYDAESEVEASYYEIYKEHGYDLLTGYSENKRVYHIENLAEIKAMTDGKHQLHMKNLSRHRVQDITQALELLEHGNSLRQVAETHLNEASSRSHAIFTIYLTIKHSETKTILQPKLHLVDLAGSERIGRHHEKSEKIMTEGKNINLSLHHLQQVIVALTKRKSTLESNKRHHVPYRNSTMTLVLRDSLGGNSNTSMIATISAEEKNLEESLSTCRFAQQVASITNRVVINEIEDSDLVIAKLRDEIETLKQQLVLSHSRSPSAPLRTPSEVDQRELALIIEAYLENSDIPAILDILNDGGKVLFCFQEFKRRILKEIEEKRKLQQQLQASKQNVKKSKTCVIL